MQPSETPQALASRWHFASHFAWRMPLAVLLTAALLMVTVASHAAALFDPDAAPVGWVSRPAITSNSLKSGTEVIFRTNFIAGVWSGNVSANYIDAEGDAQFDSPWTAANTGALLDATNWDGGRRIVTRNSAGTGVALRWSDLSPAQQALFGNNVAGPKMVNFLRGDRSNEAPAGALYRTRTSVQGDIQHSTLVHWKHLGGQKRLYVGGNDGMLHAFDASNGQEVFAYVPSMLLPRLPRLAATPYSPSLFVDGGLVVAEVKTGSSVSTLLVGALGGGGKGLYMLDVSSPAPATEAAAAALIKWEITPSSTGFANLGYTYAAPRLARLNHIASGTTVGAAAVVVGNGYQNTGNGRATLLLIDAITGALIREIDTGSGSTTSPNGLSTPTLVDTNFDGTADLAYAGDIDGNLWRFDLSGTNASTYTVTKLASTSPLQAITTAPAVMGHPKGGQMVIVSTGRMLTAADSADTAGHYVYGVWDGAPAANTTWLNQTPSEVSASGQRLRTVTNNAPNWASGGHRGWRLNLIAGERVVGEGQFVNDDRFYFTSTNPTVAAVNVGDPPGTNWVMEVNYLTGGSPVAPVFDINQDGYIDTMDNVGGLVVVGKNLGAGLSSQQLLTDLTDFSLSLFNRQSGLAYTPPVPATVGSGVSGGHFDVDFYFNNATIKNGVTTGTLVSIKHNHEYDDTYDVTGVNFLNASDASLNLGNKLAAATPFKLLVMNQYLNPASTLSVGGGAYESVKTYGGLASQTNAATLIASLPIYTRGTVNTLSWNLPLDAFKSKDWWGDGAAARAGLIPTQTGCVNKVNADGTPSGGSINGPNGERHNGAFTIQLIRSDTPASALELNYAAGGAKYGWRVKQSVFASWVLAEYTTFWHHPNGKCYGQAGWVANAPEDYSGGGKAKTPALGSADPIGTFGVVPVGVTVVSVTSTIAGNTTTTVVTYSDGKTQTTTIQSNGGGSETVTVVGRDGSITSSGIRMSSGSLGNAPEEILQGSRRINWREVIRQ